MAFRPFRALRRAVEFVEDNQLGKRVYDALLAPGTYIPQDTVTRPDGSVVVVQEEVVIPQGVLLSNTIRLAIASIGSSWVVLQTQFNGEFDLTIFLGALSTLLTSVGVIWRHIRSWMPVRGMATPVPTIPAPISQ